MGGSVEFPFGSCGCFIVPPRMLKKMAASGDPVLASKAAQTLRVSEGISAFRAQLSTRAPSPTAPQRTGLRRQVFNCGETDDLPGDLLRSENDPAVVDTAANQAFDNVGTSWTFYNNVFGRQSVDGNGRTLVSSVHFSQDYDNALWNGNEMVYGDGDGKLFKNFTNSLDVIAHELTHGVTQYSINVSLASLSDFAASLADLLASSTSVFSSFASFFTSSAVVFSCISIFLVSILAFSTSFFVCTISFLS